MMREKGVTGIGARQHARKRKPVWQYCRDVLHGVHRDLGLTGQHGHFELFNEEAFAADFREWPVLNPIALRDDFDEGDLKVGVGDAQ
jgi:hypothetical protein